MRARVMIALTAFLVAQIPTTTARGIPGRELGSPPFSISTIGQPDINTRFEDKTAFDTAAGWDFGDRSAYACAWAEFYRGTSELFEVHYELVAGYTFPLGLSDSDGAESADAEIESLCGDGIGPGPSIVWDGSDHFPHGTALRFFDAGKLVAEIDYERDDCSKIYWTPGNEPGEAWLWWDPDGPENNGHHALNCGGLGAPPQPIVRAFTKHLAAKISVCTVDSLAGDICSRTT